MGMTGFGSALTALKYSSAVEVIDEVLASNPTATLADVRQYASAKTEAAQSQLAAEEALIERAVCRYCDVEIVRGNDGTWYHGRTPAWGSRGCRSYSYTRLDTWDDTLSRTAKATPARPMA